MPWLEEEVSHMEGLEFLKRGTAFVREVHERMEFRGALSSSKSHSLLHHLRQLSKMFEGERAYGTIRLARIAGGSPTPWHFVKGS